MSDTPSKGGRSVAVVISGIGLALVICVVGVASIAAPKFMRFQNRSLQSECKSQLRALSIAERAFYAEFNRYSPKLADVNFSVEKGNRYQYRLGPGPIGEEAIAVDGKKVVGALPADYDAALPDALRAKLGVKGTCPECELTASCVGNADFDDELDVWSVTVSVQKNGELFTPVAGELINHVDDARE